ncbi:toll/interleukin-1 receptor domain-containing protein [Aquiflexum sp. TKW24L]|uniref:toll/interleukin-1 receptor domain-containing protein n=1 Tax=Aquiflexum sp. TKW24L TaxID=2942212 RepID=UPI0020BE7D46|nr:toll/interleukin-1 receptor domain-containing protein [Aquiflexum sp. TKW24L]MCL6257461.1 toll/interleukin-1 receptor domain-containing protein [Aquiflexum sp. TKW24L]
MKILISHSWQDKSLATRIFEDLKKDGHEIWFDIMQLLPGDPIQSKIDQHITNSDVIVVLWSKNALNSHGVYAEIETASKLKKRIIPVQLDETTLSQNFYLNDLLGIPMQEYEVGSLLLRRALTILMASEMGIKTNLVDQAIGNITDLGGFLNYINTYRLQNNQNDDGYKEDWIQRITDLFQKNDQIRTTTMPQAQNTMKEMESIMAKLEHGNASMHELNSWLAWCDRNYDFHPSMVQKMKNFILKDIQKLKS